MNPKRSIVLGSQSQQRRALLSSVVPESRIRICPPRQSREAGFADLSTRAEIEKRLSEIVLAKSQDVRAQQLQDDWDVIITADTVIVVEHLGRSRVLGKPDGADWQQTVRDWFDIYYANAVHEVLTVVRFQFSDGTSRQILESTRVQIGEVRPELLEWYLEAGDPLGKAGGYGIQSTGSLFVNSIEGSLTNVIGLPLEQVWCVLAEHNLL